MLISQRRVVFGAESISSEENVEMEMQEFTRPSVERDIVDTTDFGGISTRDEIMAEVQLPEISPASRDKFKPRDDVLRTMNMLRASSVGRYMQGNAIMDPELSSSNSETTTWNSHRERIMEMVKLPTLRPATIKPGMPGWVTPRDEIFGLVRYQPKRAASAGTISTHSKDNTLSENSSPDVSKGAIRKTAPKTRAQKRAQRHQRYD